MSSVKHQTKDNRITDLKLDEDKYRVDFAVPDSEGAILAIFWIIA